MLEKVYGDGFIPIFINGFCGNINHCDFVNYWSGSRAGPALAIINHFEVDNVTYCREILATFQNNVVSGTIDKEFVVDTVDFHIDY